MFSSRSESLRLQGSLVSHFHSTTIRGVPIWLETRISPWTRGGPYPAPHLTLEERYMWGNGWGRDDSPCAWPG